MMKMLILLLAVVLIGSTSTYAQGLKEWFAQKKTQREYLIEQIGYLKLYLELAEKGYKIAQEGLTMISSFKRGEFELHKNRFDSLMIVKSVIGSYGNVERITDLHDLINMICERGGADLEKTGQFTSQELDYCKTVYARLYNDGQVIITHLLATIRSGNLSLSDDQSPGTENYRKQPAAARNRKSTIAMKKKLFKILLLALMLTAPGLASAQTPEVVQLVLNIEKLNQLRQILEEFKKGYEILFKGYNTIKDLSKGNFKLHEAYLDGLLEVNPVVKKYGRLAGIIDLQLALVREYRSAYDRFASMDGFSQQELAYMRKVYKQLTDQSIESLDALTTVITAKKLRASDDERLKAIDAIYAEMQNRLEFLRYFNSSASVLGLQRAREKKSIGILKELHDIGTP
jgi:hypothetical protein